MSEPTYRIVTVHDPHSEVLPWDAAIYRVSDELHVKTVWGTTEFEALQKASAWIECESTPRSAGSVVFTDEAGKPMRAAATPL